MITTRALAIGAFITLGLTVAVSGHHSFAAFYFEDQSIEIEGDIVEVQFKSPHVWVHVRDAGRCREGTRLRRGVGEPESPRT